MDADNKEDFTQPKRASPTQWTQEHKDVLYKIICVDNNGEFNDILTGHKASKLAQADAWQLIVDQFCRVCDWPDMDKERLRSLWKRIKADKKGQQDR